MSRPFSTLMTCSVVFAVAFSACKKNGDSGTKDENVAASMAPAGVTPEVEALNKVIYGVGDQTNGTGVVAALDQLDKLAAGQGESSAARIYQALALPLRELDGFVWRIGDLGRESDPIYALIVDGIRGINYRHYAYGDHIYQALVYLTRPQPAASGNGRFQTFKDLQIWGMSRLKPAIEQSIKILDGIDKSKARFAVDMKLFAGVKNGGQSMKFLSAKNEVRTFMPYHVDYLRALFRRALATVNIACAYNLDELPYFINENLRQSWKTGLIDIAVAALGNRKFSGRNNDDPVSAMRLLSPIDFNRILHLPQFGNLFVWHPEGLSVPAGRAVGVISASPAGLFQGADMMKKAKDLFIESLENESSSLHAYIDHGRAIDGLGNRYEKAKEFLWNPLDVLKTQDDDTKRITDRLALMKGGTSHTSVVTGQSFSINAPALFAIRDLKSLFPNRFEEENNQFDYENVDAAAGDKQRVLLYRKGDPIGWPDPTFAGVFPDLRGADGNKVKARFRDASLDFSTSIFAMALPGSMIYSNY